MQACALQSSRKFGVGAATQGSAAGPVGSDLPVLTVWVHVKIAPLSGYYTVSDGGGLAVQPLHSPTELDSREIEFLQQKEAFESIPPLLLVPHQGKYVVSRNGIIVDHDEDIDKLTARFFGNAGDVPVYISKIGNEEPLEIVDTPFFEE